MSFQFNFENFDVSSEFSGDLTLIDRLNQDIIGFANRSHSNFYLPNSPIVFISNFHHLNNVDLLFEPFDDPNEMRILGTNIYQSTRLDSTARRNSLRRLSNLNIDRTVLYIRLGPNVAKPFLYFENGEEVIKPSSTRLYKLPEILTTTGAKVVHGRNICVM